MERHHWSRIALRFIEQNSGQYAIQLGAFVIENLGEEGTILSGFESEPEAVLDAIVKSYPREIWTIATRFLGPPIDSRAWRVREWLRRNFICVPPDAIWKWIDEDTERRAWYAASFATGLPGKGTLTRELLVRYGHRSDVRRNLAANLQSGDWQGSLVTHFQNKKKGLAELKAAEDNENVRRWIDDYCDELNELIEQYIIEEERDDFHNPPV